MFLVPLFRSVLNNIFYVVVVNIVREIRTIIISWFVFSNVGKEAVGGGWVFFPPGVESTRGDTFFSAVFYNDRPDAYFYHVEQPTHTHTFTHARDAILNGQAIFLCGFFTDDFSTAPFFLRHFFREFFSLMTTANDRIAAVRASCLAPDRSIARRLGNRYRLTTYKVPHLDRTNPRPRWFNRSSISSFWRYDTCRMVTVLSLIISILDCCTITHYYAQNKCEVLYSP